MKTNTNSPPIHIAKEKSNTNDADCRYSLAVHLIFDFGDMALTLCVSAHEHQDLVSFHFVFFSVVANILSFRNSANKLSAQSFSCSRALAFLYTYSPRGERERERAIRDDCHSYILTNSIDGFGNRKRRKTPKYVKKTIEINKILHKHSEE